MGLDSRGDRKKKRSVIKIKQIEFPDNMFVFERERSYRFSLSILTYRPNGMRIEFAIRF